MATTRERIIETVSGLLERQGYHATGVKQIVDESNAPKGSLYYYFPEGKEGIAVEAVECAGATIRERLETILGSYDDPADAVRGFIVALADYVRSVDCRGGSPITAVALETAGESERLTRACAGVYAMWEECFASKLRDGGVSPARAADLATLINATIEGAAILSRVRQNVEPLLIVAGELHSLIRAARPG